jgi:hypothetical protein
MQSGKSPLAGKLASSLKAHAKDETTVGMDFTALPPGIIGGIAKLVEAKLGAYAKGANQGQPFLYLAGVVVSPEEVSVVRRVWQDGKVVNLPVQMVPVKGLRTSQTLPLCDTRNAAGETTDHDEHVANALNELRKLGGDECTAEVNDEASLEALLEGLKRAGIYFKFNASSSPPTAQYPNERTWENWRGATDQTSEVNTDGVADTTGNSPDEPAQAEEEGGTDLSALAEQADGGDEAAQTELTKQALAAGMTQDDIDNLASWADLVEQIKISQSEKPDESEAPPWVPQKGELYDHKFPKAKKAEQVEITAVFAGAKTVNVKRSSDDKVFKGIPWDALIGS